MKTKLIALLFGSGFGFTIAWARLSDPAVIRKMLLLQELDVFLLMGSAVVVAAAIVRFLRARNVRALLTGEQISWKLEKPEPRHIAGSIIFGAGWSVAGTCPGPVAAMIGEGRLGGIWVALGLVAGIALQAAFAKRRLRAVTPNEVPGTAGL